MRFLLLQARNPGDVALVHERLAFRETLGCPREAIRAWDLLKGPPAADVIDEHDCVLVGGAGEYGVGDAATQPWLAEFIDCCGRIAERGRPMFASCFGFQALVVAGGGRIETDLSRAELGTFDITVTEAGRADPLFGPLAPTFPAQCGHKDHVLELPSGMVGLATSARSPHQALRVEGTPVYATQFHPELSMDRNRQRFLQYLDAYSHADLVDPPDRVLASFRQSAQASALLPRYVSEVLGGVQA